MMINGRKALVRNLALGERGGVAILMLLAFMVLAVPLSISAVKAAGQMSRTSQVHNEKRAGIASASAGVEDIAVTPMKPFPTSRPHSPTP